MTSRGKAAAAAGALVVWLGGAVRAGNAPTTAGSQGEGQKIFQTRCFVCHGRGGQGDGPAAAGLGANPRDFTDGAWQRSTPDAKVRQAIRQGGEAVGESSAMPPNGDLTEGQVDALVQYVRSLGQS